MSKIETEQGPAHVRRAASEWLSRRPVWVRHAVIAHVRPLPDPVPAEWGLRYEPVPLAARTWGQHPRAPTAQLDPAMPGRAQHSRSLVPASRAAGQIGAVQKRVLPPDVLGQSQRRVAKRIFEPCTLRALPPAPQPPRPRVRYSPPPALLLRPPLHGVLLCPHEPQRPRLVQFLHRPRQRVRVRLQPSGDRGAEREVVVCRPQAVRSKNGETCAQRAVPPVQGELGVVHTRPVGQEAGHCVSSRSSARAKAAVTAAARVGRCCSAQVPARLWKSRKSASAPVTSAAHRGRPPPTPRPLPTARWRPGHPGSPGPAPRPAGSTKPASAPLRWPNHDPY